MEIQHIAVGRPRDIKGYKLVEDEVNGIFFVADGEPPPCNTCENFDRCAKDELACAQFLRYFNCQPGWEELERIPTREIFDQVFVEDDHDYLNVHVITDILKGNTARLHLVAAELVIKDDLIELASELRSDVVAKHLGLPQYSGNWELYPQGAEGRRLVAEGKRAQFEIDATYSDEAIAERVGVGKLYVRLIREKHTRYKALSAKGGLINASKLKAKEEARKKA